MGMSARMREEDETDNRKTLIAARETRPKWPDLANGENTDSS